MQIYAVFIPKNYPLKMLGDQQTAHDTVPHLAPLEIFPRKSRWLSRDFPKIQLGGFKEFDKTQQSNMYGIFPAIFPYFAMKSYSIPLNHH